MAESSEVQSEAKITQSPLTRFAKNWLAPIAIVLAVFLPIRSVIADWYDVPTGSMEPTIVVGDRIGANKLAFGLRVPFTMHWLARWDTPAPGEIVILHSPADGTRLVKRVIAGPGDSVGLVNNHLVINGARADYAPLTPEQQEAIASEFFTGHEFACEKLGESEHTIMITPNKMSARNIAAISVPQGYYFVMGDNRDNSSDSRAFGFVHEDLIVGRSSMVVISLDRSKWLMPRFSRFFKALP